jgi:hypothetical protein
MTPVRPLLAFFGLVALIFIQTPRAFAGPCPPGQIFRVSKNACMDRAEAVKLGIVHDIGAHKPALAPEPAPPPGDEQAEPPVRQAEPAVRQVERPVRQIDRHVERPARQIEPPLQEEAMGEAERLQPEPIAPPRRADPPASPYGALDLNAFAQKR